MLCILLCSISISRRTTISPVRIRRDVDSPVAGDAAGAPLGPESGKGSWRRPPYLVEIGAGARRRQEADAAADGDIAAGAGGEGASEKAEIMCQLNVAITEGLF